MMRRSIPRFCAMKASVPSATGSKKVLVLYGSQTGTAESFARMLGPHAAAHNLEPEICTMNAGLQKLQDPTAEQPRAVLCVCSTYGTGEFPTNAEKFAQAAAAGELSRLKGVDYSIFGLGNSNNDNFNAAAKRLDRSLKQAGAKSMLRMQLSCELSGHDAPYRTWKRSLWKALGQEATSAAKSAAVYDLTYCPAHPDPRGLPEGFLEATVHSNVEVTPEGYNHPVHHLKFDVPGQKDQLNTFGRYATSRDDHVMIMPHNTEEDVKRALTRLGITNPGRVVEVTPKTGAPPTFIDMRKMTYETILKDVTDLSGVPSRSFLEALATIATDAEERAHIEDLANDLSRTSEYEQRIRGIFTILDVLEMFPKLPVTLDYLLSYGPRLVGRTYSLARDTTTLTTSHEIVYSVPTRTDDKGRVHEGLCTKMLNTLKPGAKFTFTFVPRSFKTPNDEARLVIVALGSGIGSARALLQHRALQKANGKAVGLTVLYYGFRNAGKDDLFREEFDQFEKDGLVEMRRVPSHDQEKFITPMDTMDSSLNDFLSYQGAVKGEFLYCGLGGSVPLLVETKLRELGIDVATMRSENRYHEEYFTSDPDVENLLKDHNGSLQGAATLAGRMGRCEMFCMQCEQTFKGRGCHKVGVCGKTPEVAALQDLTIHSIKVLGWYAHRLREMGVADDVEANRLTLQAMFATLTNVNFDAERFVDILKHIQTATNRLKASYAAEAAKQGKKPDAFPTNVPTLPEVLPKDQTELVQLGRNVGVLTRFGKEETQSAACVGEMLMYGLKGIAAYTDHSLMNQKEDPAIYAFLHKASNFLISPDQYDLGQALALCVEAGKTNVAAMDMLYKSNSTLGVPTPNAVSLKPKPGKCILISGHDLIILEKLLEKTEPLGINVFTHGEMLPAHSYPNLKKYKTLAGNFGGAWMRQSIEFPHFPGPVLMTTNCLTEPHDSYIDRIFTAGAVGWKGCKHVGDDVASLNLDPVIAAAQAAKGFTEADKEFSYPDPVGQKRPATYTVGFGHETILGVAPTIVEQIQKGNITRFFLIGGCDGFEGQRSYYTDLVKNLPPTAVVLTLGCGKFRINHLDLGTIGDTGIPRILDMGQCNDSFSAIQVAIALAGVLKCEISDLPLSIVLSWFEQKAVAVLLSCIALGLKPIHIGPTLPAFVTPAVLDVLVKEHGLRPLGDPAKDAKEMCAAKGSS